MGTLVLCGGCSRHFRADESTCPFCRTSPVAAPARRFAPIGAGASRSRRYALRAALLAGSATASCSQSTGTAEGNGGAGALDASSSGGASAQGGANQGGASGGTAGRGGAGNAGSGNGGASGGAGNGGAGGGALVPGRACPGFTDGDPARVCRMPTDCPPQNGYMARCVNGPPSTGQCPIPGLAGIQECGPTVPCAPDWECRSLPCDARACALTAPCTDQNCHGDRSCVNGSCVPTPCDQPGGQKCPAGLECVPNAQPGQPWCRPAQCTNGYVCPPPLACGRPFPDTHGCGGTPCEVDGNCACGYCVNRACAPQLGLCDYQILGMPYGCVWPDEELV